MRKETDLICLGLKLKDTVDYIEEFYPELNKHRMFKILISISKEYDKISQRHIAHTSREGGFKC